MMARACRLHCFQRYHGGGLLLYINCIAFSGHYGGGFLLYINCIIFSGITVAASYCTSTLRIGGKEV